MGTEIIGDTLTFEWHPILGGMVTVILLIKTITKFSNVIGYHQPDLSTNRTVCTSCLLLDSILGHCKWTERVM